LFCRGLPVWGCCGGGKSRWRGIESGLDGSLIGLWTDVGEAVANLRLAGGAAVSRRGLINGAGDVLTEVLEASAAEVAECFWGELGLRVHEGLRKERGMATPRRNRPVG
jgi:hypothetical protein